jgi:two-component system, sensor histidine kinase and response regulator
VTAHAHSQDLIRRAYDLGAFDFVTKPYDPHVLRGKVGAFVAFYERGRQLQQQQVALQTKDRYLGILAHDLRTPLAVLDMGVRSLVGGATPSEVVTLTTLMGRSVQRMGRLIEDLLEYARAAAHRMPMRKSVMDLASLCEELLSDFRAAHQNIAFTADLADDAQGTWDRERLHQVLANLLSNAVKYGDGRVHVRLSSEVDSVSLVLSNGGEPIPASRLGEIFEPFVQGADRAGGVGLGLSIVREIVQSHGGEVGVSSDLERTCFTVRLPRNEGSKGVP